MRTVVARAELLDGFLLEVIDAAHLSLDVIMYHDGEHIGNRNLEVVVPLLHVRIGEHGKRSRILRIPECLHRGELHRACLCKVLRVQMPACDDADDTDNGVDCTRLDRLCECVARFLIVEQLPSRDGHDDESRRCDARKEGV